MLADCAELNGYLCTWCILDFMDENNNEFANNYGISILSDDPGFIKEVWFSTHVYATTPSYDLPPVCELHSGGR